MRPTLQKTKSSIAVAAVAIAGLLGGCAQTQTPVRPGGHLVKVNSTATGTLQKGTSYSVVAVRDAVDDSSLLYAEASRLVKAALGAKGLTEAPNLAHAEVVVELDYGMAPARVSERAVIAGVGLPPEMDKRPDPNDADTSRLRSAARGPLEKHLVLTAREANPSGDAAPRTLWRVEMSLIDLSNDLRKYLPLLAAVGVDQIGQDSGGSLLVRIEDSDKTVGLLKRANAAGSGNAPEPAAAETPASQR